MCFSASASFIAGAALTVAGAAAISQVRKPRYLVFACMPILFAIQQICEGFVWLSLSDPDFATWHYLSKQTFLFFAQVVWPFFIPFSFYSIERSPERKKILRYLVFAGAAASLIFGFRLIFSASVAQIDGCHISYELKSPLALRIVAGMLYVAAIVIAPFFSTWRRTIYLASANVISLVVTEIFFEVYLVSVWCFFAAAQSVLVFFIMREIRMSKERGVRNV
jgi:hypothetical protein